MVRRSRQDLASADAAAIASRNECEVNNTTEPHALKADFGEPTVPITAIEVEPNDRTAMVRTGSGHLPKNGQESQGTIGAPVRLSTPAGVDHDFDCGGDQRRLFAAWRCGSG